MGNAFDNSNLVDSLCGGCNCTGFSAAVSFVYDSGAKTIVFTDGTTYPNGANRKIVNLRVTDKNCKTVDGNIAANDGDDAVTVSVASLDASEGLELRATVVSDDGCISDGHFGRIGMTLSASGSLANWDKAHNGIIISDVGTDDES